MPEPADTTSLTDRHYVTLILRLTLDQMGRLMIQNEAQGLGGALEHLLFLKISGDLVLATGRSLGTELVDLNTKRVTRIIGEGKPADALCALPQWDITATPPTWWPCPVPAAR